jgi:hypothetical protein
MARGARSARRASADDPRPSANCRADASARNPALPAILAAGPEPLTLTAGPEPLTLTDSRDPAGARGATR